MLCVVQVQDIVMNRHNRYSDVPPYSGIGFDHHIGEAARLADHSSAIAHERSLREEVERFKNTYREALARDIGQATRPYTHLLQKHNSAHERVKYSSDSLRKNWHHTVENFQVGDRVYTHDTLTSSQDVSNGIIVGINSETNTAEIHFDNHQAIPNRIVPLHFLQHEIIQI
jgi:hypothetical protein